MQRAAGIIEGVAPLRHNAFQSKLACVLEHELLLLNFMKNLHSAFSLSDGCFPIRKQRGKFMRADQPTYGVRGIIFVAFLALAIAMPAKDAAAQDPMGGAIIGGAAGAILGGALGGGRGTAVGAIIGGTTGAVISCARSTAAWWLLVLPKWLLSGAWRRNVDYCCTRVLRCGYAGTG